MIFVRDLGEDEIGCIKMGFYNDGIMLIIVIIVVG